MTSEEVLRNVADAIRAVECQGKRALTVYVHPTALNALLVAHAHPDPQGRELWVHNPEYMVFGVWLKTRSTLREDEVEVAIDPVFVQSTEDGGPHVNITLEDITERRYPMRKL
jgi:hypothetical protein